MEFTKAPWQNRHLVLICSKCGRTPDSADPSPSAPLKSWLKQELQKEGSWGAIRVVESGCLDICPSSGITVASWTAGKDQGTPNCQVIHDPEDRQQLLAQILATRAASRD